MYEKPNPLLGDWITNDNELAIAKTITEKKIGNFDKIDMAALVEVMAQWRLLLGVTSDSTEQELIFICQFIYDNFPNLTLSDVKKAMNWAISGKLDLAYVSTKSISGLYVSKCLNTYEDHKAKILNEIAYNKQKHEDRLSIDSPSNVTALEKATIHKEYLINIYEKYHESNKIDDWGSIMYKWFRAIKMIQPNQDEVNEAVLAAQNRLIRERQESFNMFTKPTKQDIGISDEEKKKRYAREFFIAKIFDQYDIVELIKLIKIDYFNN